jgi:hypothetical protein
MVYKNSHALCVALLACVPASHAHAVTDIRWTNDAFEHAQSIAPGKIAEVCGAVNPQQPIDWKYSANDALAFNIHRHVGSEVIYATRSFGTRELNGRFAPKQQHEWCWMWTNDTTSAVNLKVKLQRAP